VEGLWYANLNYAVGIRYDKKDDYNYMMDFAIVNEEVEPNVEGGISFKFSISKDLGI